MPLSAYSPSSSAASLDTAAASRPLAGIALSSWDRAAAAPDEATLTSSVATSSRTGTECRLPIGGTGAGPGKACCGPEKPAAVGDRVSRLDRWRSVLSSAGRECGGAFAANRSVMSGCWRRSCWSSESSSTLGPKFATSLARKGARAGGRLSHSIARARGPRVKGELTRVPLPPISPPRAVAARKRPRATDSPRPSVARGGRDAPLNRVGPQGSQPR